MAHKIEKGIDTVAIQDDKGLNKGWHGLGTAIVERLTEAEAIAKATGLDTTVEHLPLSIADRPEIVIPDKVLAYTAATGTRPGIRHGIVSSDRPIRQNINRIRDLLDYARASEGEAYMSTGGTLCGGTFHFLSLAGSEISMKRNPNDRVIPLLAMIWGHDGITAETVMGHTTRMVCMNTAKISIGEAKGAGCYWPVKHTKNMEERLPIVKAQIAAWKNGMTRFMEVANTLDTVQMPKDRLLEFVGNAFQKVKGAIPTNPTTRHEKAQAAYAEKGLGKIKELCDLEFERTGAVTLWNATNAVTEWLQKYDQGKRVTTDDETLDRRAISDLCGNMADEKAAVYELALASV